MPKETVYSCYRGLAEEGMDPLPDFRTEVLWGREHGVQIATTDPEAPLGSRDSGLYVDLDRCGINDLIRILRKARDQAFGRDE